MLAAALVCEMSPAGHLHIPTNPGGTPCHDLIPRLANSALGIQNLRAEGTNRHKYGMHCNTHSFKYVHGELGHRIAAGLPVTTQRANHAPRGGSRTTTASAPSRNIATYGVYRRHGIRSPGRDPGWPGHAGLQVPVRSRGVYGWILSCA
jgi:hypothetical protein